MCPLVIKFLIFIALSAYVLAAPLRDDENVQDTGDLNKQPTTSFNTGSAKDDQRNISADDDSDIDLEGDDESDLDDCNENENQQVSGQTEEPIPEPDETDKNTKMILIYPRNVVFTDPKSTDPKKSDEIIRATGELPKDINSQLYEADMTNPFRGILVHGVPVIFDSPTSPVHRIYFQPKS